MPTPTSPPTATRWVYNYKMCAFMGTVHILAVAALPFVFWAEWRTNIFALAYYIFSAAGITAGSHRLWSHRSYEAKLPVRILLACAASAANQGSIFHWARDHRVHHKFSETPADPHNAKRGLFFAHIGWLLVQKDAKVIEAGKKLDLSDLEADPVVMFQRRFATLCAIVWCFVVPTLVPALCWGESWLNAYMVPGVLRYVCLLHATWLVNSVAHTHGTRPYAPEQNPSESPLVALLAIGEGWHNWHHAFPYDYAASELGMFHQFNPTKLFIDACCLLGLAGNRKRATTAWGARLGRMRRQASEQDKEIQPSLCGPPMFRRRTIAKMARTQRN